jgi:hypothetical protein
MIAWSTARKRAVSALFAGVVLLTLFVFWKNSRHRPVSVQPPPGNLVYFGVNLDWTTDSPAAFNWKAKHIATVYVQFCRFPLDTAARGYLDPSIDLIAAEKGMAMITLEPHDGLDKVTPEVVDDFARRLAGYNKRGVPVLVRFAHEMNGSWYSWSQRPEAYIRAFRLLAEAIHKVAPDSAMMWAPNYGGGYPFSGGVYERHPGQESFNLLDTDGDGLLTMQDDPYLPYYPGDDAVDWVGMSLYHWGTTYPWGENEMPEPGEFITQLTGTYNGLRGDDRDLPDFYQVYAGDHGKPLAIVETAALFNKQVSDGADELSIKQSWWRQVFDREMLAQHPGIKMINWFEHIKVEREIGDATIDWRVFGSKKIATRFLVDLPTDLLYH